MYQNKQLLFIVILTIIFFSPISILSQTDVEKATREVDKSFREILEEKLKEEQRPKKPVIERKKEKKKKEKVSIFIKKINFVGVESLPIETFDSLAAEYLNRTVSSDELETLTKAIEQEYFKNGMIAAAIVPPQEIKEGILTVKVIESRMGKLQINEHKYFRKNRILYYWRLNSGEIIHYTPLSRSLQLMNKNPDREVKAALNAGEKPGTTDVVLNVTSYFPLHLTATYDREGSTTTGEKRTGWGLKHNNFLGLDDTLLGGYTFGVDFSGLYIYHTIPITAGGASIVYGYSYSKSFPKKEFESQNIDSRAKNTSIYLHQDLFKKEDYIGEIYGGLDIKDKATKADTGTLNRDRLRILRLGTNLIYKDVASTTYINPEFSQGLNLFGARRRNPLSSRNAKNTLSKFNLQIKHKRRLPLNLQANFNYNMQLSSTKLPPQEEFSLGGINSIRGYPSGDYLADTGFRSTIELLLPALFIPKKIKLPFSTKSLKDDTTVILFFDYGYGFRRGVKDNEGKKSVNMRSLGIGFRIKLFGQAFLRLEWGFPIGDRTITEDGDSRFHISLEFEDKFSRQMQRINKLKKRNLEKQTRN